MQQLFTIPSLSVSTTSKSVMAAHLHISCIIIESSTKSPDAAPVMPAIKDWTRNPDAGEKDDWVRTCAPCWQLGLSSETLVTSSASEARPEVAWKATTAEVTSLEVRETRAETKLSVEGWVLQQQ